MASWLSFFFGIPDVRKDTPRNRPPPRVLPIRDNGLNPKLPDTPKLPALKNWSHPFKDSRDPLLQLTHMAKAAAGYYPLGRSGMFHGGAYVRQPGGEGLALVERLGADLAGVVDTHQAGDVLGLQFIQFGFGLDDGRRWSARLAAERQ